MMPRKILGAIVLALSRASAAPAGEVDEMTRDWPDDVGRETRELLVTIFEGYRANRAAIHDLKMALALVTVKAIMRNGRASFC